MSLASSRRPLGPGLGLWLGRAVGWVVLVLALMAVDVGAWSHLSREELDARLGGQGMNLVAFVAPAEQKCKNLEPQWEAAQGDTYFPMLSIDCTGPGSPCQGFDVETYPTIKLFKPDAEPVEYLGPRRVGAMVQFLARSARLPVTHIEGGAVDFFKAEDDVVFIAFLGRDDSSSRAVYERVARRYRSEFTFAYTDEGNRRTKFPSVTCHRHLDGVETTFEAFADGEAALERFVVAASRPVISELTAQVRPRLVAINNPIIYIFAATEADRAELRVRLHRFAKEYYASLTAATVDPLEFPELMGQMGLEPGRFPAGAVHQLTKDRVYPYPYDRAITDRELQHWGVDVWQGRVKPYRPPGSPPPDPDEFGPANVRKNRHVSMRNIPGMRVKVGHEEL